MPFKIEGYSKEGFTKIIERDPSERGNRIDIYEGRRGSK